jgi:hypothetical protein
VNQDTIITCSKCGMRMTTIQEQRMIRCVTSGCPLVNVSKAGQEYIAADEPTRKEMRGILIGKMPERT